MYKAITDDTQEEPSAENVQELLEEAENLQEQINGYRDVAQRIDDKFRHDNEDRNLCLDDIPYGEELIRTEKLPDNLVKAFVLLTKISEGGIAQKDAIINAFEVAEQLIEDARDTIDDCKTLPHETEEE